MRAFQDYFSIDICAIKRAMAIREDARPLDERPREILRLIIRSYVTSGEPVGSRTLAKSMDWRLSPATIRNIMSDLEDEGYLAQPHTSAGRIPSEKGYRFYVDNLADSGKLSKSDERYISRMLSESETSGRRHVARLRCAVDDFQECRNRHCAARWAQRF